MVRKESVSIPYYDSETNSEIDSLLSTTNTSCCNGQMKGVGSNQPLFQWDQTSTQRTSNPKWNHIHLHLIRLGVPKPPFHSEFVGTREYILALVCAPCLCANDRSRWDAVTQNGKVVFGRRSRGIRRDG
jgi:hypothetical protein